MTKNIFIITVAIASFSTGMANACSMATDPAMCERERKCEEQGLLKPFCILGATQDHSSDNNKK
ncbi:hypothetical protein OIV19_07110 [Brucella sp. HL-2]|nr:hypothetical protein [Brucella sp. HL-2]MCV9907383.1 hypothetical protein [Brucella sp. HL-2]